MGSAANGVTLTGATITPATAAGDTITVSATGQVAAPNSGIALAQDGTAVIAGTGALKVGVDANSVTFTKAAVTATAVDASFVAISTGAATVNLAATNTLVFADGGSIATAGTGKLTVGKTKFDGAGAWTAGGDDFTITGDANGALLSAGGSEPVSLTASGASPVITQDNAANSFLNIGDGVTIALGGDGASVVGTIKLESSSGSQGGIKMTGAGAAITTGNTAISETPVTANGGVFDTTIGTASKVIVSAWSGDHYFTIVSSNASGGKLMSITWAAGTATLTGNSNGTTTESINSNTAAN
jgi:hypothetical protein